MRELAGLDEVWRNAMNLLGTETHVGGIGNDGGVLTLRDVSMSMRTEPVKAL
jgi:hypothetical protein